MSNLVPFEFSGGAKVRDKVTGFIGFVTARCEYMTGCIQYEVVPATLKDGVPQAALWVDEGRLQEVSKRKHESHAARKVDESALRRGGPQVGPSRSTPPQSLQTD